MGSTHRLARPTAVFATALALTTAGYATAASAVVPESVSAGNGAASAGVRTVQATSGITSTISGTWEDRRGNVGTVTGSFVPERFSAVGDRLLVRGQLVMQLRNAAGTTIRTVRRNVVRPATLAPAPAAQGSGMFGAASVVPAQLGSCEILNLVLGPLDLDLLGLVIELNQVELVITAVPGAGNLLGNLLCAVVGLLDGGLNLGLVAAILNGILDILEGLGGAAGASAPAGRSLTAQPA